VRQSEAVFVDSGAWIALAVVRDPYHARAKETWERLHGTGARLHTSIPVVMETFTFLDRATAREVALAWRESLETVPRLKVLPCTARDLTLAWPYFERRDLHKLSMTDAVSFVLMRQRKIRTAFAFDAHFAAAGFQIVA
jgi:predicted nucleic acid-binding protein